MYSPPSALCVNESMTHSLGTPRHKTQLCVWGGAGVGLPPSEEEEDHYVDVKETKDKLSQR